jgi:hypothetical protein
MPCLVAIALAAAAILAVVVLVAGCGSSKSTTSTAAAKPALTKAQFLAQGNAICNAGNSTLAVAQKALEKAVGNAAPSAAQVAAYVNGVFVPSIQGQIEKIGALGAPAGEEAAVAHLLGQAQADLNQVKSKPTLLLGARNPFADFARAAHAYGLTACARKA